MNGESPSRPVPSAAADAVNVQGVRTVDDDEDNSPINLKFQIQEVQFQGGGQYNKKLFVGPNTMLPTINAIFDLYSQKELITTLEVY